MEFVVPEMRAAYMQENVRALAPLGGDLEKRVRDVASAQIDEIMAAARTSWLPVELDLAVLDALLKMGGEDIVRQHASIALRATTQTPLLRPILDGAVRLLGLKPESLFRWSPQAWSVTFRGCGALTWELSEKGHGRLLLVDSPGVLAGNRAWVLTAQGAFEGGLALAKVADARVELTQIGHVARYDLFWKP